MRARALVAIAVTVGGVPLGGAAAEGPPPFAPGEQIELSIEFLHVYTARAQLVLGRPEGSVWPVVFQARTDGVAGVLDIREHYVSYWDAEAGLPRGSDLNAIEVGDRHTDRARFDREDGKVVVRVLRKGLLQERSHPVPRDVQDLAGALLFLRRQPLEPGSHVECPVFTGSDTFTLRADVDGREVVTTPAGTFQTVRVRVRLGFKERFRTDRDARIWLTDDSRHVPVRMTAEFAVGTATATLSAYRPGAQVAAAP